MNFKNYLKSHPEFVKEYNQLKSKNVLITPEEDFSDLSKSKIYNQGKGEFVEKVLKLAELQEITVTMSTDTTNHLVDRKPSNENDK